tara:strand:- start:518 stop:1102 length:585 start_codon:yes stop_codon:yes gene_type:complete
MKLIDNYFENIDFALKNLDKKNIFNIVKHLKKLRKNKGRLFIIGVGGSAGNASHAVNDFRKLCGIDAYTPVDNISEITAKTNDEGFQTIFNTYLELCRIDNKDTLLVFSVGGGNIKKNVSVNIVNAIKYAKMKKSKVISIVGRTDGYAYKNSDYKVFIKIKDKNLVTPISESFQALLWHLLVSHPILQINKTKW